MLFAQAVVVIVASTSFLLLFRQLAGPLGLLDQPNSRKVHDHPVALVGGISIVPVLCAVSLLFFPARQEAVALVLAMLLIFGMGVADDRIDMRASNRLLIQILAAAILVVFGDANIRNVGNLFGLGVIGLGGLSEAFTVICIVTAINAFNMIDGTDGLLGGLVMVTLTALASLFAAAGHWMLVTVTILSASAMIPYIYANLLPGDQGKKVFMGDAGSMTLGLFVSFLVIKGATSFGAYKPATALFLIALPIFDIIRVFGARLARGVSPFTPEQNHLHHLLMFRGKAQAAIILILSSAIIAAVGAVMSIMAAPEAASFAVFCLVLALLMTKVRLAMRFGEQYVPIDVLKGRPPMTTDRLNTPPIPTSANQVRN